MSKPAFRPHTATISRNERKSHFYEFVEKNGMILEKKELMATYTGKWGVTTRTLKEYIKEYENTGALVKRGKHIVTAIQNIKHLENDFKRLKELSEVSK